MTTNERDFAKKLTGYLDAATAELKPGTAYRLQSARQQALARLAQPERVAALRPALAGAGVGSVAGGGGRHLWASGKLWVGVLLIVAAVLGWQQWQAYQQLVELEETDAAILSSDLPIDAYLDRGFQNWLTHASED